MSKGIENVKNFIKRDWSVSEKLLLSSALISTGFILGVVIAPIKKGISIRWSICSNNGNNNGNNNNNNGSRQIPAPKEEKEKCKRK